MDPDAGECCAEFSRASELSRRRFLQGVAGAGAGLVATSVFGDALRQTAYGATADGNVLVVLSLRGGVDGLGMVVPHGDPAYYSARPTIAVPRSSLVAQDAFFGLHPNLSPLAWMFESGELAAVHAVGMDAPNRSHFLAMEQIEDADPGSAVRRGWVNRMIGLDTGASPTEAIHINSSITPTLLTGPAPTLATNGLKGLGLAGMNDSWATRRRRQLATTWSHDEGALGDSARAAVSVTDRLSTVTAAGYTPANGVKYPTAWPSADLSAALRDSAQLIRAGVGAEVISIDYGSWDMHSSYGTTEWGQMQTMITGLAESINAFMRDLGTMRSKVTLVTISEFGRRVAENGNRGLDHGWGNMMLLAGGGVRGGQYYGQWPWLSKDKLVDGDLKVTTDYRQVLGEVITKRFPDRPISSVFPGLSLSPLGVMR